MKLKDLLDVLDTEDFIIVIIFNSYYGKQVQYLYNEPNKVVNKELLNHKVLRILNDSDYDYVQLAIIIEE